MAIAGYYYQRRYVPTWTDKKNKKEGPDGREKVDCLPANIIQRVN